MANERIKRREILRRSGAVGLGLLGAKVSLAAECLVATPPQTEGPFYPIRSQLDTDTDLIQIQGRAQRAEGQPIRVHGRVFDGNCRAVPEALVEIWQACATGRYNHPSDPNTAVPLDPYFQYWGRTYTDELGDYEFLTIKPGAYPAAPDWQRPPHIHFKVTAPGRRTLTTQMYFAGDALNEKDRILQSLEPAEKDAVVVAFNPEADSDNLSLLIGEFNIYLERLPELH